MKATSKLLLCSLLALSFVGPIRADEPGAKIEVPLVNRVILGSLTSAADKMVELAAAIPEDKYEWAPMEGVNTVAGILTHVAGANFYIANLLGSPIPEGVDPRELGKGASKEELIALYEQSVEQAKKAILSITAEGMREEIDVFGSKAPRAQLVMILADHAHEHLGQLIAYARANHITPPWSK